MLRKNIMILGIFVIVSTLSFGSAVSPGEITPPTASIEERINDNEDGIAENADNITKSNEKIAGNTKEITNTKKDVATNLQNITTNTGKIAQNETAIKSNEKKLVANEDKINKVNKDIESFKKEIKNVSNDKNTNKKIDDLGRRVKDNRKLISHTGALSASLAALHPMQYDPLHPNQILAGIGSYRGEQGIALGVTHYFNENFMSTLGVSAGTRSSKDMMANLGFTWKIGGTSERQKRHLPKEYSGKQMASIYMMQSQIYNLMNENKELKKLAETNIQLTQKVNKLEKMVETLMKKVK